MLERRDTENRHMFIPYDTNKLITVFNNNNNNYKEISYLVRAVLFAALYARCSHYCALTLSWATTCLRCRS